MENILAKLSQSFAYVDTDLAIIKEAPYHFGCCINILCVQGSANLSTGIDTYSFRENDEITFLSGTLLQIAECTDNFRVRILAFSKELYQKTIVNFDTSYFRLLDETALYHHPLGGDSWANVNTWFDMARILYTDDYNQYREDLISHFVQSYLIWTCNTIPTKFFFTGDVVQHRQKLMRRFLNLVRDECVCHREVGYFADRLKVSTRYLNDITKISAKGTKQIIDEQLIAEMKALLCFSDKTITEVAQQLNFPDQSYMGRFFKRYVGCSPRTYRAAHPR